MRHRKAGVKLNRTTSHRQAMFKNMVTSLFKHERIRTTDVKAKELRRWADHIITLAKRGDLHARRQVLAIVREKEVVHKLFAEAKERFGSINGGYTRIVKIGHRPGDAAPVSLIELIAVEEKGKKGKKKAKSAPKKKGKTEAAAPKTEKQPATPAAPPAESAAEPETAIEKRETDSGQVSPAEAQDSAAKSDDASEAKEPAGSTPAVEAASAQEDADDEPQKKKKEAKTKSGEDSPKDKS